MITNNATATMNRFHGLTEVSARRDYRPLLCSLAFLGADCLACVVSMTLAGLGAGLFQPTSDTPVRLTILAPLDVSGMLVLLIGYFAIRGRYTDRTPFWTETGFVVCACLVAAVTEVVIRWFMRDLSGALRGLMTLIAFAVLAPLANAFIKQRLVTAEYWTLPVLVVGDGPSAAEAETALGSDKSLGYQMIGRIDPLTLTSEAGGLRLRSLLDRYGAKQLLIALDGDGALQRQITEAALRERVPFAVVPAPHAFPAFGCEPMRVLSHNTMFLLFRQGLSRPTSKFLKATFDVLVAAAAIVLLGPLLLGLGMLCRFDGGPALFAHWRVGAHGRPFRCLKFRTMAVDGDRVLQERLAWDTALAAEWAATRKLAHDPRVTRIGRFLRKTSLDELPQLFNVLQLEMSLVGPRPIVINEVPLYGEHIAHYYAARPGLTGLWQVSGRSDTSYERRVQLDVWYVNNWSIWCDVAVLLKTIPAVIHRQGAY